MLEFLAFCQLLVFVYFLLVNCYYSISSLIALLDIRGQLAIASRQHIRNLVTGVYYRPISILVPAYNEEATIATSLRFSLSLRYPEFELVVVNDGSTDNTMEVLRREFRLVQIEKPIKIVLQHNRIRGVYVSLDHPHLVVVDKENGGKADALNAGINASQYPLVCSVDADSLLEEDALMRAAKLFVEDREVVASGGIVRVLNGCTVVNGKVTEVRAPSRFIERLQSVEYLRGFLVGRTSWNCTNSMLIISGAFGIFRKDIVLAIGGYRRTVGEDMDIVIRMHRHCLERKIPCKVVFVPDPVCWTQVPSDWRSLLQQRNRWHRGLIDSLWHSRRMTLNPRYGAVGLLAFPYFILAEALGPLIEFLGYVSFVIFYFMGMLSRDFALIFLTLAVVWGMSLNLAAVLLDNLIYRRYKGVADLLKISACAFLEGLGYRQLLVVERLFATFTLFRRDWDKPVRREIKHEQLETL
ncbi:glycosyltransferase family 2 protein [Geomonas sp. RF6]|uniref:glycosyltransferase family 2 protein n=1 Tax=Geomonas sp. RF6 TaxID=2897342 RepID=UPI001E5CF71E|nr:glycosyltransferase family 2 protein [Geomonas sp. RF6]UFS70770.1 glycosyltransferase family 2 protein [Geomonas sp. RF6]